MVAAAERIVALAERAIAERGRFMWALAGGSTPEQLYELLATSAYGTRVDWSRVHFFWGDERCVEPAGPGSNYGMARRSLLDVIGPPASNVHRMRGELEASAGADDYERELKQAFAVAGEQVVRFDSILLGMGGDGHTASLFPGSALLQEAQRSVCVSRVDGLSPGTPATRLTLTLRVLNAARHVMFLVAGADKAQRLAEVLQGEHPGPPFPAELVRPAAAAEWFVDDLAGALLGAPTRSG
jgi:6-phosphogluconolactonase